MDCKGHFEPDEAAQFVHMFVPIKSAFGGVIMPNFSILVVYIKMEAHTLWCGFLALVPLYISVTKIDCSALLKSTCRFVSQKVVLIDLTFQVDNHPHILYYADPKEYFQSLSVGGIS